LDGYKAVKQIGAPSLHRGVPLQHRLHLRQARLPLLSRITDRRELALARLQLAAESILLELLRSKHETVMP
jgi:hypothetical protein